LDLSHYLRILRRNWRLIVGLTLVGILVGGGASVLSVPTYTAETQLFVAIQGSGSVTELQEGNTFGQSRVQSYVKTVTSPAVLQPAINSLGLSMTSDQLAARVKASADLNTVLISISVADASSVRAAAIAQAVANSLVGVVDSLEKPKTGGSSPVSLSVIRPAVAPPVPSAPDTNMNLLVGFVAGLLLGLGGALVRTMLDSCIRGEADLRRVTDAPLLGAISFAEEAVRKPLLTQAEPQSPRAESFRQLRTNLEFASFSDGAKSILITSSLPGEGKSTTATNLAVALAQAGKSVCLVDADLRRPAINTYLGLDSNAGLTTALTGHADVNDVLQQWGDENFYVLASGQIPPNPSELLGSAEMATLVQRLERDFDAVIIDAPPLLPVTDAAVLSRHVGGVVVVVGSQKLRHQDLEKSLNTLRLVGGNVLGIVLNCLPAKGPDAYSRAGMPIISMPRSPG
jgi:capsular exopolysaccharide synthesis family protein